MKRRLRKKQLPEALGFWQRKFCFSLITMSFQPSFRKVGQFCAFCKIGSEGLGSFFDRSKNERYIFVFTRKHYSNKYKISRESEINLALHGILLIFFGAQKNGLKKGRLFRRCFFKV